MVPAGFLVEELAGEAEVLGDGAYYRGRAEGLVVCLPCYGLGAGGG